MHWLLPRAAAVAAALLMISSKSDAGDLRASDLKTYLAVCLETHPGLLAADARVASVNATARSLRRSIYNPVLSTDGERGTSQSIALGISQTFDVSGKRAARTVSGQAQMVSAVAERAALRHRLAINV